MAGRLAVQASYTELTPCSLVRACRRITARGSRSLPHHLRLLHGIHRPATRRCQARRSSPPVPAAPRPAADPAQRARHRQTQVTSSFGIAGAWSAKSVASSINVACEHEHDLEMSAAKFLQLGDGKGAMSSLVSWCAQRLP